MRVEIEGNKNKSLSRKFGNDNLENLVIGVVYRHPGSNYKAFSNKINNIVYELNLNKKSFVIVGDVNINLLKYNIVGNVTDYLNNLQGAGCLSYIDKPTRVCYRGTRWETSCIDHMYTNIGNKQAQAYVTTSGISADHFTTIFFSG